MGHSTRPLEHFWISSSTKNRRQQEQLKEKAITTEKEKRQRD